MKLFNNFYFLLINSSKQTQNKLIILGFVFVVLCINLVLFCLFKRILWLPFSVASLFFLCIFQRYDFVFTKTIKFWLIGWGFLLITYLIYAVLGILLDFWPVVDTIILTVTFALSLISFIYILTYNKGNAKIGSILEKTVFLIFILNAKLFFSYSTNHVVVQSLNPGDFYFVVALLIAAILVILFESFSNLKMVNDSIEQMKVDFDTSLCHNEISTSNLVELQLQIDVFFKNELDYTESSFDLDMLAKKLQIPSKEISNYLNTTCGINFNQLVGEHRIRYAVAYMKKHPNYSLRAIMEKSGFSSYPSFVFHFKRIKNMTPSEFKQSSF